MEPPQSPDDLIIEPLAKRHKVGKFNCGDPDNPSDEERKINHYLINLAKKSTLYGYGRTYVAVRPEHPRVWAYYTLAASYVDAKLFPSADGCPKHVSVILLARIGVENVLRGGDFGRMLMADAFQISVETSERVGVHSVVLNAKNEKLIGYYKRYGFTSLMDDPLDMYLPIPVIIKALSEQQEVV